ncbi:MAG: RDD family protein [Gammaproteobacteria bacterium]
MATTSATTRASTQTTLQSPLPAATLLRRLAALLYDGLLLFGVIFTGTVVLLPFTNGHAIEPGNPAYQAYLLGLVGLFYGWCWTHGGQTLGMKAWHIRVQTVQGHMLSWEQAGLRLLCALLSWLPLGLGFYGHYSTVIKNLA